MEHALPNYEMPPGLTPDQIKYFEALQVALRESEKRATRFEESWSALFDQNKTLREAHHNIQQGYENLRIQKGGFGFKMLLLSGLGGFLTALVLCFVYLKLKPKDPHLSALQDFRRKNLFEYELALSQKQFESVRLSLENELHNPESASIKTELEMLREMVEAAERGCH